LRTKVYETTTFLNVDLEISSAEDLAPLAEALGQKLSALQVGRVQRRYWARLELRTQPKTPDVAIRRLARAIGQLPQRQRAYWKRATVRDFNVGIQAADEPDHSDFVLKPETVAMVGKLGGRIVITIYGAALNKISRSSVALTWSP
jgi:hypothetical protein